ncbi:F-box protein [Corchorus olitorius]|uniref:F-box protein n=1 Tax=Corchorus olitorius TaxID=93759 RepID=A0A1R3HZL2_9ROSI|nr:F-box protein [Corchorus olitorius]
MRTIDKFPWAMSFRWRPTDTGHQIDGECSLIYPPLKEQLYVEKGVRGKEFKFFLGAKPQASSYGWVLFKGDSSHVGVFFLYSLLTAEVIKLSESDIGNELLLVDVMTFSLDASSPKCVIFGLKVYWKKISIHICSPSDGAWKTYEFIGFNNYVPAVHAIYANGFFYCVFFGGQLGAFNLQLKEWTMLTLEWPRLSDFDFKHPILVAFDEELQMVFTDMSEILSFKPFIYGENYEALKLLNFDFSEKRWVKETSLNNHVLFVGCTCFSCPAVGETSQLAINVFSCSMWHPLIRCYDIKSNSVQYENRAKTVGRSRIWIEMSSRGSGVVRKKS